MSLQKSLYYQVKKKKRNSVTKILGMAVKRGYKISNEYLLAEWKMTQ
jgi:hypothetical protein